MSAFVDLTGQRFGRLVVLHRVPPTPGSKQKPRWTCKCDCGTLRIIEGGSLRRGMSTSCGCFQREDMARRRTTHGLRRLAPGVAPGGDARASRSSTYASWANMRARCNTPGAAGYANYGGRGIKVCARWDSFENFLADMGERPKGTSLDRVNANGDYAPDNCRWATPTVQLLNRRDRISLNAREQIIGLLRKGVTQAEIAETFNVSARTVRRIWTAIQLGTPAANVPLLRGDVAANGTTAPTRTDEPKA